MKLRDPCGPVLKRSQHRGLKVPTKKSSVKRWLMCCPRCSFTSWNSAATSFCPLSLERRELGMSVLGLGVGGVAKRLPYQQTEESDDGVFVGVSLVEMWRFISFYSQAFILSSSKQITAGNQKRIERHNDAVGARWGFGFLFWRAVNSNAIREYMSELYSAERFDCYTEKIRRSDDGTMWNDDGSMWMFRSWGWGGHSCSRLSFFFLF